MTEEITIPLRRRIGYWLFRYRGWGLLPLLFAGLFVNISVLPTHSGRLMMIAGAVGIFFGSLLRIVCSTYVSRHDAHDPYHAKQLVMDGPYAVSRNPAYLGEGAIVLGIAMMSRMPWLVLVTLTAGLAVMAFVIEWEEESLRLRFGRIYDHYCKTVPRWFSWSQMLHPDTYAKAKGRIGLLTAIRAESLTLLIGLLSILAFITKADVEFFFFEHLFP